MKSIKNIVSKFFSKQFWSKIYLKKRFYFVSSLFVLGFVLLDIEECAADLDNQVYDQKVNIAKDGNGNNNLGNLPLASKAEINELVEQSKKNKDIINPDVARKIAIVEFETWRDSEDKYINAKFNKQPIVVYDSLTSLPKFYEFILVDSNGNQLATVTCFAQKQGNPIIRNVMPFVRNYNHKAVTKSANQKVIDDGVYPSRIHYGIITKSGGKTSGLVNGLTGKSEKVKNLTPEEQKQFLENLSQKERENIGITNLSDYLSKVEKVRQEAEQENKQYWDAMDMVATNIIKMTDEEIEKKLAAERTKGWTEYYDYIIPEYKNIEKLIWGGFCVPSAFAWVYRGLYNSYNSFDLNGVTTRAWKETSYDIIAWDKHDTVETIRNESKDKDGGLYEFFVSRLAANSAAVRDGRETVYKNGVNPVIGDMNKYSPALSDATGGHIE